ncbi:hypothetical protein BJF79_25735 [Actinomadura sp. CNU-125]|uniref:phosphopantetheine-binding protein n=1 Tax=Actinomadura sp. CNU-125 TaxID=1904961 RepID=UPI0009663D41|nr:phosphopantetheine-binding protein [Actinomadura sp. CNU-125]OLT10690.1 hypothetical protein BJF79_25735 [Actinomadura sp. CNU-125]
MSEPAAFTLDDLRALLRADDADELTESRLDEEFDFLGYDSLAKYELASQLVRRYDLHVSDEAMDRLRTPRQAIDHINDLLAENPEKEVKS